VIAVLGIPRIVINSTMISNFGRDTEIRRAVESVNQHLGASGQLQVVLETDYPDAFKEPENLALIEELQAWLAELPDVTGSTSLVDYLKLIYRGFNGDDPAFHRIPESRRLVTQLLFFGSGDDVAGFVNSQYQIANIRVRTTALDSADLSRLVRRIEARLAELPARIHARVTGNLVLLAKTNDEIAYGQAISVGSAFFSIFLIMAMQFMSFRVGFISMVPNVLPVRFYFGILGWSGITLNVTTGLVASIVLRIAVDDTIHFLRQFNAAAKRTASGRRACARPCCTSGARSATTAALCWLPGALLLEPAPAGRVRGAGRDHAVPWLGLRPDLHAGDRLADPDRHALGGAHARPGREPAARDPALPGHVKAQGIVALMTQIDGGEAGNANPVGAGDGITGIESRLRGVEGEGTPFSSTRRRGGVLGEVGRW
jgi:predicted RND superfamily exporter protein